MRNIEIEKLPILGETAYKVVNDGHNRLLFYTNSGNLYTFLHTQDCCESVYIESIDGDLDDLVDSELLVAELASFSMDGKSVNYDNYKCVKMDDSTTWSFYKFATKKGYVTVRWVGSSNGYYSESVDMRKTEIPKDELREYKLNNILK